MNTFEWILTKETDSFRITVELNDLCSSEEIVDCVKNLFPSCQEPKVGNSPKRTIPKEFRDVLFYYRREHGLTQKDLGELLGVSGATISYWESGKCKPGSGTFAAIESLLGFDDG